MPITHDRFATLLTAAESFAEAFADITQRIRIVAANPHAAPDAIRELSIHAQNLSVYVLAPHDKIIAVERAKYNATKSRNAYRRAKAESTRRERGVPAMDELNRLRQQNAALKRDHTLQPNHAIYDQSQNFTVPDEIDITEPTPEEIERQIMLDNLNDPAYRKSHG